MPEIQRLDSQHGNFWKDLDRLLRWESVADHGVRAVVDEILVAVRDEGDAAVLRYTERFDRLRLASAAELEVPADRLRAALERIPEAQREALDLAAERIRRYAQRQRIEDWQIEDPDGTVLGQRVTPLDSVGLYVPGGKAAYPSSVLMNAIPAKVAGVPLLVMVVPAPAGELNDLVLAAAAIAGVDRVFTVGGAQAVAALAYGTESIPAVDKIVGPGNIFVA
ncbi:MAG: histidinol dehydrogenase, partial [Thioalkalivibrio sp.]|nr:histidinol dehydrogenase [Thioalkalivibrio sp.]